MNLVDVHAHLLGKNIFPELTSFRKKWQEHCVIKVIQMSSSLNESKKALEFFKNDSEILIGIGKHPWKVKKSIEEEMSEFEVLLANKDCKVIGEVGLDFYAIKDEKRRDSQKEWLKFFIELSNKYKKPLNLHVTGAEREIADLLHSSWDHTNPINIHWYSGPLDALKELIQLGCYFSINPAIFYSKNHQLALNNIPIESVLTESDTDVYYKPLNFRGDPSVVENIIEEVSRIKGIEMEELSKILYQNFENYLKI
jgi:TatD DNase family protein